LAVFVVSGSDVVIINQLIKFHCCVLDISTLCMFNNFLHVCASSSFVISSFAVNVSDNVLPGYQQFQWVTRKKCGNGCICQHRLKKFRWKC